jgi:hypothetical protein
MKDTLREMVIKHTERKNKTIPKIPENPKVLVYCLVRKWRLLDTILNQKN